MQQRVRSLGAVHRSIGNAKGTAGLELADGRVAAAARNSHLSHTF